LNEALPRPREVATNIADIVRTSKKVIGASAQAVVRRWKSANPTVSSYPDLALRAPCPYRTVFEGKYFSRSGLTSAETALATNIYQTFFYRGLAKIAGGRAVLLGITSMLACSRTTLLQMGRCSRLGTGSARRLGKDAGRERAST
jgi:hypothetical protein